MSNDDLTTFTPGEVETITGLSTVMQRNWRRHGYLPVSKEGHARFNAFEIARLMVMKMFSDRGVGPSETAQIAEVCARGIVYAALQEREAYNADLDLEALRKQHIDLQSVSRSVIAAYTGERLVPAQYFLWWADGNHHFDGSIDDAMPPFESDDPRIAGPIMMLDLKALGRVLLNKTGRPIANA